jgi:DNA-binding MarR family transcriptional regulator
MSMIVPPTGTPTNGATVTIGDCPPLTREQIQMVLAIAGHPDPAVAALFLSNGTSRPTIVKRTAMDWMNEMEVAQLREQRLLLLSALRKKLSPLWLRALDSLESWHFISTLAEELGISVQQTGNVCSALFALGLVERQDAPRHLRGRSPWLYRRVDAVAPADVERPDA